MKPSDWKKLLELLPVPAMPKGLEQTWKSVESRLGVTLPNDYKRFIDYYGTGSICGFGGKFASLNVWNLRSVPDVLSWVSSATRRYDEDRKSGYEFLFSGYPNPGGLLGWGTTPDGDFFNWRMKGKPKSWDVVFYHSSSVKMILLEGHNYTRVLLDLLEQTSPLMPKYISPDNFAPPCRFTEEKW